MMCRSKECPSPNQAPKVGPELQHKSNILVMYQRMRDTKTEYNVTKEYQSDFLHSKGVIRPHVARNKSDLLDRPIHNGDNLIPSRIQR